jgi:predicted patatin/cPLA2 family phospholipase
MSTLIDELNAHKQNRKDKRVFGLVLQGGGMRGVYSAGIIAPLVEYGLTDAFDHVIGSSAGAINGAYFLGADPETFHTYTDDLTNKNFVNLLRREHTVDIDYLVDLVLKHKRPVNIAGLLKSRCKLHIVMTDAKSGKKVVISDHNKFTEIYEEFRATAALPLLYDKKVMVNNRWYIDGGVADLLPVDVAVKLGCTDIVVVMTQRIENYVFDRRHDRLVNHIVKRLAKNQPLGVKNKLPTDERMLKLNLRILSHPTKKRRLYILQPSEQEYLVTLATTDKVKIEKLAHLGVTDMDEFLHLPIK